MGQVRPESARAVLELFSEKWDEAATADLTNSEIAAVLELWMCAAGEDSTLLRVALERLRQVAL